MAAIELYETSLFTNPTLQFYYRFEGDLTDSKNGHTGTEIGTLVLDPSNGMFGDGAGFGTGDKMGIFDYGIAKTDFTINFWAKFSDEFESAFVPIAFFKDEASAGSNPLIQVGATDHYFFNMQGNSGALRTANGGTFSGSDFHMITATYNNSTNAMILYFDGSQTGTATYTGVTWTTLAWNLVGGNNFAGAIDDLAFFTSVLSPTTIDQLYNGTLPPPPEPGQTTPSFLFNFV